MVSQPEFEPLLPTIGQLADFIAGKITAAPNWFLSEWKQCMNLRESHAKLIRSRDSGYKIEVDRVAAHPVIPDRVSPHDKCFNTGL